LEFFGLDSDFLADLYKYSADDRDGAWGAFRRPRRESSIQLMPRLLMFAPCEKVILDQQGNLSIITVLSELLVTIPEPPPEPEPAKSPVIPLKWDVTSLWMKTREPDDVVYEERFALIDPSGKPTGIGSSTDFAFGDKPLHRIIVTVLGFPISLTGRYTLKLWMHEKGREEGEPVAEFPILLRRALPKG
jgi:hypothetical protein